MWNCTSCGRTAEPGTILTKRIVLNSSNQITQELPTCKVCLEEKKVEIRFGKPKIEKKR